MISRVEEMSLSPEDNLGRILNESEKEEGSSNNSDEASQDLDIQESEDRINIDEDISGINNGDMGETNDVEAEEVNDTNYENQGIEIEDLGIQNKENENEEKIHIQDDKENGVKTSNHKYDLRPNRTPNYMHKIAFLSVHAGVRKWGDKVQEAIRDELKMLIKEEVFMEIKQPTTAQKDKALMIHCFVVEKGDGRIKARAVADGRSQHRYMEEET